MTEIPELFAQALEQERSGKPAEAIKLYRSILDLQSDHPEANYNIAMIANRFGQTDAAIQCFKIAVGASPGRADYWKGLLDALVRSGRREEALAQLNRARSKGLDAQVLAPPEELLRWEEQMNDMELFRQHHAAAAAAFPGTVYNQWLAWFQRTLQPATYLEIGVESGKTLELASPPTRCVGIDPEPQITVKLKAPTKIYAQTSDAFFHHISADQLFGGDRIDLAFIDGFHSFDQALKDFINVEAHAHEKSVVLFHDVYPLNALSASRERQSKFWLGDTWKVVPLLKEARPDLNIRTIPTYPSGLAMVTGLNPHDQSLKNRCSEWIAKWLPVRYADYADNLPENLNRIQNSETEVRKGFD
jgi:hypothetical protein